MKRVIHLLRPVSDRAVRNSFVLAVALALLLALAARVHAQSGGTFELTWFTVDGGGAMTLSGGTFELGAAPASRTQPHRPAEPSSCKAASGTPPRPRHWRSHWPASAPSARAGRCC